MHYGDFLLTRLQSRQSYLASSVEERLLSQQTYLARQSALEQCRELGGKLASAFAAQLAKSPSKPLVSINDTMTWLVTAEDILQNYTLCLTIVAYLPRDIPGIHFMAQCFKEMDAQVSR